MKNTKLFHSKCLYSLNKIINKCKIGHFIEIRKIAFIVSFLKEITSKEIFKFIYSNKDLSFEDT